MAFELPDLPYAHDALAAKGMSAETLCGGRGSTLDAATATEGLKSADPFGVWKSISFSLQL